MTKNNEYQQNYFEEILYEISHLIIIKRLGRRNKRMSKCHSSRYSRLPRDATRILPSFKNIILT